MRSGGYLGRECDSGRNDKDKSSSSSSDIFKKEMQEIEQCISAAKCKVPLRKPDDRTSSDGNKSTKNGKK